MTIEELTKKVEDLSAEVARLRQRRVYQRDVVFGEIKQQHIDGIIVFRGDSTDRPTDGSTEIQAYYSEDTRLLSIWDATNEVWVDFPTIPASPATYTPTNVSTDRSYDADSTTTAELADVLGTLIADLQSIGIIQ